jgi:hypothetical protein
MNFFKEKPADSEAPIEKEGSRESGISRFTGWLGKKLQKADETISETVSPERGEIGKAMDRLLDLKKSDLRNAAIGLGCTSLAVALLLNSGRVVLSASIPGMEHMAYSGINPDDLASIPGSIIDSIGQLLGIGQVVDTAAIDAVPVPVEAAAAPAPVPAPEPHKIELPDGDNGDNHHHSYAYEKSTQNPGQDNNSSIGQNPFNKPEKVDFGSTSYEEIVNSMKPGQRIDEIGLNTNPSSGTPFAEAIQSNDGVKDAAASQATPEINTGSDPVAPNADQTAASAGQTPEQTSATPQENTANILESQVNNPSTGENAVNNARTVGNQVGSGIGSTSGPAVKVEGGVAHIGKG